MVHSKTNMVACVKHHSIAIPGCVLCKLEQWQRKCLALKKENEELKKDIKTDFKGNKYKYKWKKVLVD